MVGIGNNSLALIAEQAEAVINQEYEPEEARQILATRRATGPVPSKAAFVALAAFELTAEVRRLRAENEQLKAELVGAAR